MTVLAHVGGLPLEEVGALAGVAFAPGLVLAVVVVVVRRADVRRRPGGPSADR